VTHEPGAVLGVEAPGVDLGVRAPAEAGRRLAQRGAGGGKGEHREKEGRLLVVLKEMVVGGRSGEAAAFAPAARRRDGRPTDDERPRVVVQPAHLHSRPSASSSLARRQEEDLFCIQLIYVPRPLSR
jgi:hypothetical protein